MEKTSAWANQDSKVRLHQLSDDPADGTASEQIAHLATLSAFDGWSCVDPDFTGTIPDGDPAQWRWSDGQIVSIPVVPASVTPRQVRLLLLSQNLLSQVEAMIASSTADVKITWQYASEFRRDDPLLVQLAANLDPPLTSEQIDQFFIAAAQI